MKVGIVLVLVVVKCRDVGGGGGGEGGDSIGVSNGGGYSGEVVV